MGPALKYCKKKKSPAHSGIQIAEIPIDLLHMTSKRSISRTTSNFQRSTEQKMNENYIVDKHLSSTIGISPRGQKVATRS